MVSIILVNDEKIDIKRTTVFAYKDKCMRELDLQDVAKIDSSLCPDLITHKTNIVFDAILPTGQYTSIIEELSVNTYHAIYDPSWLAKVEKGLYVEAGTIIPYLMEGIENFKVKKTSLEKQHQKADINTVRNFINTYIEACTKFPKSKIKIINQ